MNESPTALFPFLLGKINDEEVIIIYKELLAQYENGLSTGYEQGREDGYEAGYAQAAEDYY